jgi:hypothetical protein
MTAIGREACPPCPKTDDIREPENFVSELDGDMTDIADQRSDNTDVDNTCDCRGALTAAGLSGGSCRNELPPNSKFWNECGAPVTKIGHRRASTALVAIRQDGKMTLQSCRFLNRRDRRRSAEIKYCGTQYS